MPKDSENIPIVELPSQPTEPSGFSPQQMVRCDECLRANPPTRVNCLYCGLALPVNDASVALAKPSLRPLESWEQGYNCIALSLQDREPSEELSNQVAALLRLEPGAIHRLLATKRDLPLARSATPEEAALIERRLSELGWKTITVPDSELRIESAPPMRLRRFELRETDFLAYQILGTEGTPIDWEAISLIVVGRLFVKQVQLRERKRRRPENEILDSSEVASDDSVVDIYVREQPESWRVTASAFDFSCLGANKALLAGENFPRLIELIRGRAPNAEINESYQSVRHCLELAWPAEQRSQSAGMRLRGSKYSTSQIISTNSEPQFTRYSRLCDYLKKKSLVQPS